jgi:hypothetical protein
MTENVQMGSGLAAGAEYPENAGICAREKFCGDGGRGGSPNICQVIRWNNQLCTTGFDFKKDIGGLDAIFGEARALVELDEFHTETTARAIVTGHDEENAVLELHLSARRHDRGEITGAEGILDRGDERARIEQAMDVGFGQDVHWQAS